MALMRVTGKPLDAIYPVMSDTMSNSETVTVDLGDRAPLVQARIESGEYESVSEVIRAALEALDREDAAFDDMMRQKVQEALDDPRPSNPMDEVFERLERKHTALVKALERESEG